MSLRNHSDTARLFGTPTVSATQSPDAMIFILGFVFLCAFAALLASNDAWMPAICRAKLRGRQGPLPHENALITPPLSEHDAVIDVDSGVVGPGEEVAIQASDTQNTTKTPGSSCGMPQGEGRHAKEEGGEYATSSTIKS